MVLRPPPAWGASLRVVTGAAVHILIDAQLIQAEGRLYGTKGNDCRAAELEDRYPFPLEHGADSALGSKEVLRKLAQLDHRPVSTLKLCHQGLDCAIAPTGVN